MINLTGKSVFVKTQEEYLSVLKIAKLQGFASREEVGGDEEWMIISFLLLFVK